MNPGSKLLLEFPRWRLFSIFPSSCVYSQELSHEFPSWRLSSIFPSSSLDFIFISDGFSPLFGASASVVEEGEELEEEEMEEEEEEN